MVFLFFQQKLLSVCRFLSEKSGILPEIAYIYTHSYQENQLVCICTLVFFRQIKPAPEGSISDRCFHAACLQVCILYDYLFMSLFSCTFVCHIVILLLPVSQFVFIKRQFCTSVLHIRDHINLLRQPQCSIRDDIKDVLMLN